MISVKHRVEDVEHRHVLKNAAVAATAEERSPRLDGQIVAGKATVGAGHLDGDDVAVERAQRVAAGGGHQFEQHRLADQRFERDGGVARQRGDLEAVKGADVFLPPRTHSASRTSVPSGVVSSGLSVLCQKA